jgi:hypothetical protein
MDYTYLMGGWGCDEKARTGEQLVTILDYEFIPDKDECQFDHVHLGGAPGPHAAITPPPPARRPQPWLCTTSEALPLHCNDAGSLDAATTLCHAPALVALVIFSRIMTCSKNALTRGCLVSMPCQCYMHTWNGTDLHTVNNLKSL